LLPGSCLASLLPAGRDGLVFRVTIIVSVKSIRR
jgi:hypothetical protein